MKVGINKKRMIATVAMNKTTYATIVVVALGCIATSQADLSLDLVAYYDFEDLNNNAIATGGSGINDLTLTSVGGATVGNAGGRAGSGAVFSGATGQYLTGFVAIRPDTDSNGTVANNSSNPVRELGSNFSIAAWYKLDTDATANDSDRYFVIEGADTYDVSYGLRNFDGTSADGQTYSEPALGGGARTFTDVHTAGVWQHMVYEVSFNDGTGTNTVNTYVDNVLVDSITGTGRISDWEGLNIGNSRAGGDRTFDGMIDEVAAWNRVLTDEERTQVYDLGAAGQAIPEPATLGMVAAFGGAILFLRRRLAI